MALTTIPFCLQAALASAVVLGFLMAETGIAIQHDANHGALSSNNWACYCLGLTLDIVGASSFMWKQQHVVGHHAFTNVDGLDPDLRVNDPDVRRVTRHQPHQPYQVGLALGKEAPACFLGFCGAGLHQEGFRALWDS